MKTFDLNTIKGRLTEYIRIHEKAGIRDFERRMGFSDGMISRPGGFSMSSLTQLALMCKELSLRWLLTGEGQMLEARVKGNMNTGTAGQMAGNNINNYSEINNYDSVCEEVKVLRKIISDLRSEKETLLKQNDRLIGLLEKFSVKDHPDQDPS